jgi:hypothetical protein
VGHPGEDSERLFRRDLFLLQLAVRRRRAARPRIVAQRSVRATSITR